ncbi:MULTISPECIES: hypothetical protein [unclassified Neomoorella]|uniref:hypothetical protein n=1 Tax=unclassified Neomoorella TaxID=2676739 RepID=UPI001141274A|nr:MULTISPECIES: hypothetical protein [unclassified Moorella (in: firmicutes)]
MTIPIRGPSGAEAWTFAQTAARTGKHAAAQRFSRARSRSQSHAVRKLRASTCGLALIKAARDARETGAHASDHAGLPDRRAAKRKENAAARATPAAVKTHKPRVPQTRHKTAARISHSHSWACQGAPGAVQENGSAFGISLRERTHSPTFKCQKVSPCTSEPPQAAVAAIARAATASRHKAVIILSFRKPLFIIAPG